MENKKKYEVPFIDVLKIDEKDVVTTSVSSARDFDENFDSWKF